MSILTNFFIPAIGLILTLVFGFWMSKAGRPYNGILFNIHKLIALGTVIVTATRLYKIFQSSQPQAWIILFMVFTAISVVALFASGAFLSIGNVNYAVVKTIHNIAPVLAVLAMALTIYLLAGNHL